MVRPLSEDLTIAERIHHAKVRAYTIGLPFIVLCYIAGILSWSIFFFLPWFTAVGVLLPLLPILIGLFFLLDRVLEWAHLRLWPIETSWRGMVLCMAVAALVIATGPIYAYIHGVKVSQGFISEFELNVAMEGREFVLIEPVDPKGQSRPFRAISTVYRVLDPIEEAREKLSRRLLSEPGWVLSKTTYFWGSCDRSGLGRYVTLFLAQERALHVAIQYGAPDYCLLKGAP